MELTLCSDGFIRDRNSGTSVGKLCKTKDGFYFDAFHEFPIFDHELDYLWSQFENNREAFEEQKKPFEVPTIIREDRTPFDIIEDIESGYDINDFDNEVMESEYGSDWKQNFFGDYEDDQTDD
jgi:hypothetical protein